MAARIAVVVGTRGRGSNLATLLRAPELGGAVVRAVAPDAASPALEAARAHGIETRVAAEAGDLRHALADVDLVCLAGFLRLLPGEVLQDHPGRVLNIHPSLLPRHGGPGMYGRRVHAAVLAAGDTESGCTVHHVTEAYDEGAIVLQATCPVLPDDTPESLGARVLDLEHATYPEAVRRVLAGS